MVDQNSIINAQNNIDILTKRVTELTIQRDDLTRFCDGMLVSAKLKADNIIQNALAQASNIVNDANKQKYVADVYMANKQQEGEKIINDAQISTSTISQDRLNFENEKSIFEEYKLKAQQDIKDNNSAYASNMNQLNILKKQLDDLSSKLDLDRKDLDSRKLSMDNEEASLEKENFDLKIRQDSLNNQIIKLQKDQDTLSQQQQNTYITQKTLEDARAKLDVLVKSNTDLTNSLNDRKATLDAQQATIASDMAGLSLQKQAQDETDRTQSDKQRDIDLQVRALNQKIQVLNDLRAAVK